MRYHMNLKGHTYAIRVKHTHTHTLYYIFIFIYMHNAHIHACEHMYTKIYIYGTY